MLAGKPPCNVRFVSLWTAIGFGLLCALHSTDVRAGTRSDLAEMTLEQLGDIRVSSVTRRLVPMLDVAASIFVITSDDIRRSAATTLPEALRLAPNLQVARLNAGQYAISARGFNNAIGNKLLVLIDGRTVYSPLFSGVFWDAQDLPLQDIERIEVISGPGGTLWGANAVNGVINVITRAAGATQGTLVAARAGRQGSQALARHGARMDEGQHLRLYAMRQNRNNTYRIDGTQRPDASSKEQFGFRADWTQPEQQFTFEGDAYSAGSDASSNLAPRLEGMNLLARVRREFADGSNWRLQAYYDRARRDDNVLFNDDTELFDLEFNHVPATSAKHKVIWGAGVRRARTQTDKTSLVLFSPPLRELSWTNVFVQDEMRINKALRVTAGVKLESNSYTGIDVLPTLRATYALDESRLLWGALSRAVRAPSRVDRELFVPAAPPHLIQGGANFESEVAEVAEVGYRAQPTRSLNYSLTAFHQRYGKLRGGRPAPTAVENRIAGIIEGIEAWGQVALTGRWRVSASLVELRKSLHSLPGTSPTSIADLGNDPTQRWTLRSSVDLPHGIGFDAWIRHESALPSPAVESYTATDVRLGWQATSALNISLLVQNLFDPDHVEFNPVSSASQIARSAFLALEWRFQ